MTKLIWLVDMSLDGFMSGPNGELDWAGADMDDELWDDVNKLLGTVDTALFGRVTYQNFEQYWPAVPLAPGKPKNELDFSRWIEETPKFVASTTLTNLEWKNSFLLGADVAESVRKLKEQAGENVLMFGSCSFASRLLPADLIDDLCIRIHPVILGVGRPLFKAGNKRHQLELTQSRTFGSGLVQLRYKVA
jgi:dihydrofolate reductase